MKMNYEHPMMYVEMFTTNSAVAACTVNKGIKWTFDCMKGPQTDSVTVVNATLAGTGACSTEVGYTTTTLTAYSFGTDNHSNNNSTLARWGEGTISGEGDYSGSYISVTYSSGDGLIYADSQSSGGGNWWGGSTETTYTVSTENWSVQTINGSTVVAHTKDGGLQHRMVAPVLDASSVNASW